MTRFLLKLILIMTLVLTMTSLAARAIGSTQPPNPALRGFTEGCEDKPQPCWYGIVPGVTPYWEITEIWTEHGYIVNDVVSGSMRQLQAVSKNKPECKMLADLDTGGDSFSAKAYSLSSNCIDMNLGDFIQMKGFPERVCMFIYDLALAYSENSTSFILVLDHANIISPHSKILEVYLHSSSLSNTTNILWNGYKSYQRYTKELYLAAGNSAGCLQR